MAPPPPSTFPEMGPAAGMLSQDHWINSLKSGCNFLSIGL